MKPNDIGRKQFYEYQTTGKYKDIVIDLTGLRNSELDDYFWVLFKGKEALDLLVSEYYDMYNNGEWWGWETLLHDWKSNPWLIKHLCSWHENLPDFVKNIPEVL